MPSKNGVTTVVCLYIILILYSPFIVLVLPPLTYFGFLWITNRRVFSKLVVKRTAKVAEQKLPMMVSEWLRNHEAELVHLSVEAIASDISFHVQEQHTMLRSVKDWFGTRKQPAATELSSDQTRSLFSFLKDIEPAAATLDKNAKKMITELSLAALQNLSDRMDPDLKKSCMQILVAVGEVSDVLSMQGGEDVVVDSLAELMVASSLNLDLATKKEDGIAADQAVLDPMITKSGNSLSSGGSAASTRMQDILRWYSFPTADMVRPKKPATKTVSLCNGECFVIVSPLRSVADYIILFPGTRNFETYSYSLLPGATESTRDLFGNGLSEDGHVLKAYSSVFRWAWSSIMPVLAGGETQSILNSRILIAGHGFGAGLATLAAAKLGVLMQCQMASGLGKIQVTTTSTPVLFDGAAAAAYQSLSMISHHQFRHILDILPYVRMQSRGLCISGKDVPLAPSESPDSLNWNVLNCLSKHSDYVATIQQVARTCMLHLDSVSTVRLYGESKRLSTNELANHFCSSAWRIEE
eukprot:ANDGO_01114.mRNA.1 hypothetical protein